MTGFQLPAMTRLSARSIGRRLKSAKAGNRGVWGSGRYGDLAAGYFGGRDDRSYRAGRFSSNDRCGCGRERVSAVFSDRCDRIGDAFVGQSGASTQAGAMPVESRLKLRASVRGRNDGGCIMRCRS